MVAPGEPPGVAGREDDVMPEVAGDVATLDADEVEAVLGAVRPPSAACGPRVGNPDAHAPSATGAAAAQAMTASARR